MIVNSTDQKLVVNVHKSIVGFTVARINYIKPDRVIGFFVATVTNAPEGIIEYQIATGNIDLAGDWIFYAEIQFGAGVLGYGKPFIVTAKNPGQL